MKKSLAFLSSTMIMLSLTACEDSGPISESETTTVFETEPVDDDYISLFNKYNCKINTVVINTNTADVYYNTPTFLIYILIFMMNQGKNIIVLSKLPILPLKK